MYAETTHCRSVAVVPSSTAITGSASPSAKKSS